MIRMFVRHPVEDFSTWKHAYDDFDAERTQMGVKGQAVFHAPDNPNDVTAWHDFDDMATAQAFVSSERLKTVMQGAGVAGEPSIWFAQQA